MGRRRILVTLAGLGLLAGVPLLSGCTVHAACVNPAGQHFTYEGPPGGMPATCAVTSWSDTGPYQPPVTSSDYRP